MQKSKLIPLSNSLENLLFPPGKYTSQQLINLIPYFNSTFTLEKHKEILTKIIQSDQEKLWWTVKAQNGIVQAKVLAIILMLQLVGKQRRQLGVFNEGIKQSGSNFTPLNSPRSKTTRALYISNQQSVILSFIKQNLKIFLRLLSNQPTVQDPILTSIQLNPISILFKTDKKKPFASNLMLFNNTNKASVSAIYDHLVTKLTINDTDILSLQGLSFSVLMKQQQHCKGKDLRIIGCEDSEIFIDSSVNSLYIVNCLNCTIYIGACEKIAFIDKCERVNITLATNLLRICNSVDSTIHYYGPSPTILTGDNRSIQIGPNNSLSPNLKNHLKAAGISFQKQYLNSYMQILCKPISNTNTYSFVKPQDFNILIMPHKEQQEKQQSKKQELQIKNLMAPDQYIKEVEQRYAYYGNFKNQISKLNLNSQTIKIVHSAYQGHFKQWLISKGYTKNLNDLVKMIQKTN